MVLKPTYYLPLTLICGINVALQLHDGYLYGPHDFKPQSRDDAEAGAGTGRTLLATSLAKLKLWAIKVQQARFTQCTQSIFVEFT